MADEPSDVFHGLVAAKGHNAGRTVVRASQKKESHSRPGALLEAGITRPSLAVDRGVGDSFGCAIFLPHVTTAQSRSVVHRGELSCSRGRAAGGRWSLQTGSHMDHDESFLPVRPATRSDIQDHCALAVVGADDVCG